MPDFGKAVSGTWPFEERTATPQSGNARTSEGCDGTGRRARNRPSEGTAPTGRAPRRHSNAGDGAGRRLTPAGYKRDREGARAPRPGRLPVVRPRDLTLPEHGVRGARTSREAPPAVVSHLRGLRTP